MTETEEEWEKTLRRLITKNLGNLFHIKNDKSTLLWQEKGCSIKVLWRKKINGNMQKKKVNLLICKMSDQVKDAEMDAREYDDLRKEKREKEVRKNYQSNKYYFSRWAG